MRYESFIIAVSLATVFALPKKAPSSKRPAVQAPWDPKGNLVITFSDATVNIGTITINDVIANLSSVCSTQGQCDTDSVTMSGQLIKGGLDGSVDDIKLTINPSGAYPTWIHNDLLNALRAAVHAAATCKDVTNQPTCGDSMAYCPAKPFTVNECTVPQYWGINFQERSASNAAPPFIGANMAVAVAGGGFCSKFTTIVGAVAGAVNGAAGSAFTLLGLACQS